MTNFILLESATKIKSIRKLRTMKKHRQLGSMVATNTRSDRRSMGWDLQH